MRRHFAKADMKIILDIHDGYSSVSGTGALRLSSNAAQMSPQRSSNVSPDAGRPRIPGPVSQSPAKPQAPPSVYRPLAIKKGTALLRILFAQ
jgi:hypothetical protein